MTTKDTDMELLIRISDRLSSDEANKFVLLVKSNLEKIDNMLLKARVLADIKRNDLLDALEQETPWLSDNEKTYRNNLRAFMRVMERARYSTIVNEEKK